MRILYSIFLKSRVTIINLGKMMVYSAHNLLRGLAYRAQAVHCVHMYKLVASRKKRKVVGKM